ncbi:MAG: DUF2513 domain-containing protein [Pseudomonas sp.]
MKRDLKLVREVLGFIEFTVNDCGPTLLEIMQEVGTNRGVWNSGEAEEDLNEQIVYQLNILETGGFVVKTETEPYCDQADEINFQLTWKGHDLLDSMR